MASGTENRPQSKELKDIQSVAPQISGDLSSVFGKKEGDFNIKESESLGFTHLA